MKRHQENMNHNTQISQFLFMRAKLIRALITVTKLGNLPFQVNSVLLLDFQEQYFSIWRIMVHIFGLALSFSATIHPPIKHIKGQLPLHT